MKSHAHGHQNLTGFKPSAALCRDFLLSLPVYGSEKKSIPSLIVVSVVGFHSRVLGPEG